MHVQLSPPTLKRARIPRRFALFLALALASVPSVVKAQTEGAATTRADAQATPKQEKPGAETTTATRSRRVAEAKQADPKSADAAKGADAAKNATGTKSTTPAKSADEAKNANSATRSVAEEKPAAVEKKPETVEQELQRRRTEIKDAKPEERAKLERALVDRLVELNMKDEALSELRLAIHDDRYDPAFFYNTGNALARLGDANAAADAYRKAISQRKGNYARALNNLGVVLIREGRWDEAYDALNAALTQENFTYAEASYNLGRLHLLRGETNLAIREWTRTIQLDPGHFAATAALARAYAEDGNTKRALAVIENYTARAAQVGGTVPREIAYARDEIKNGTVTEVPLELRVPAAPSNNPPRVASSSAASSSATSRNEPARASSQPLRALSVDPATYGLLQQARVANDGGKFDEAVRRYRNVLSHSGGYLPPANLELGLALLNLKRDAEALAALAPVAARDSSRYPVAHYHLARLYERQGKLDLAAQEFARAAELYGDEAPQMFLELSRVREKSNDAAGALAAMESYVASIARQGSVPDWATEKLNALREKAKAAGEQKPVTNAKP
ncbi:MAG: tetratricopeptide repeat protein [Pyrinomonadaceae bacterium]